MTIQETMRERVRSAINNAFDIDLAEIPVEVPPRTELGDLAFPVAFELAKRLKATTGQKQNPREIAARLADEMRSAEGVVRAEVAGAGYLNLYLDRADFVSRSLDEPQALAPQLGGKIIVEHAWFWKLAQALFEVLPRNEEDWKIVNALLRERETLRKEAKRTCSGGRNTRRRCPVRAVRRRANLLQPLGMLEFDERLGTTS